LRAARFVWLKLDLTEAEGDAELTAQRLGIVGVPALIVIDSDGSTRTIETRGASAAALATALAPP
jgi:thiol:disulfide interchange protein